MKNIRPLITYLRPYTNYKIQNNTYPLPKLYINRPNTETGHIPPPPINTHIHTSEDCVHMKLSSLLHSVKDYLGLRTPGVYRLPCECSRVHIGQRGRSVDIRLKEHQRHIRLEHAYKSTVVEHNINQGHRIQFHNSSILATKTRYICLALSGRQLRLNPTLINLTGRISIVSVNHGSPLSPP
jgi:hypothetical protein